MYEKLKDNSSSYSTDNIQIRKKRMIRINVDRKLNDVGYILPGLGDAGDRVYGTK